jgi:transposase
MLSSELCGPSVSNALFAGCDEGAETWACVASLIETCRLNAVDPEAWLADVLEKLVGGWPMAGIDDLMPWAPAFRKAGAVEQERSAA